jgi:hypothetical protein
MCRKHYPLLGFNQSPSYLDWLNALFKVLEVFMSQFFRHILGFILLVATVGLATCQTMVKAEPVTDTETVAPVTMVKS